jgi:hypothetical protein
MFIRVLALKVDPLRVIEAAVPATRLNPADESRGLQFARCLSLHRDVCSSTLEDKNLKSWRVDPRVRCCVGNPKSKKHTAVHFSHPRFPSVLRRQSATRYTFDEVCVLRCSRCYAFMEALWALKTNAKQKERFSQVFDEEEISVLLLISTTSRPPSFFLLFVLYVALL